MEESLDDKGYNILFELFSFISPAVVGFGRDLALLSILDWVSQKSVPKSTMPIYQGLTSKEPH